MLKRTFGQVKKELSRVIGQTGMQATDPRVIEITNLAQERLCTLGEWPFQYDRIKLCQFGGILSLPTDYEGLSHTALDGAPLEIQTRWFEFLESGPGPLKRTDWVNMALDLGESPVYRQPGFDGARVRVVSTNGADTGNVTVFGYDTAGVAKTVTFALPDATSTVMWSRVERVIKPATQGDVVLSYTDLFGETYQAAAYRGRDLTPTFRTYRFPVQENQSKVIDAIVRRRVFPITGDNDELLVTNLGALRLAVKGIALEDKGDVATANGCFDLAATILRDEAKLYKASRNPAPINVSRVASLSVRPDIF